MSEQDDQPPAPSGQEPGRRCGRCGAINSRADAVVCATCGALLAAYDAPAGSSATVETASPVSPAPPVGTTSTPKPSFHTPRPTTPPPPRLTRPSAPSVSTTTAPCPPVPAQHDAPSAAPTVRAESTAQSTPPPVTPPRQARQTPPPPRPTPVRAIPPSEFSDDGPEEDRPDFEIVPPTPRPETASPARARPVTPSSPYPARSRLARQTPQTVLLVGIGMVLLFCVLAVIFGAAGAETAAGLFIICGGPFALFVIGTGIVLLVTRGRTDRIPK